MPFLGARARSSREGALRLAPAPRRVPVTLALRLVFGGALGVFGWVSLGFGLIFVWLFVAQADLTSWVRFAGPLTHAAGTVTACEQTNASEGGGKGRRGTPIFGNRFTWDGGVRTGVSYATGVCLSRGQQVDVEHPQGRPELARIAGMRRGVFGPAVLLVLVFPLVGFGLVAGMFVYGRRRARLLGAGRLGWAALVRKEATNVRVNNRPVWKLTFALETDAGERHEIVARTSTPERVTDDAREPVLYDPESPRDATLWDLLPGPPRLDAGGELEAPGVVGTFFVLLPPLATLAGHGYWLWRFGLPHII